MQITEGGRYRVRLTDDTAWFDAEAERTPFGAMVLMVDAAGILMPMRPEACARVGWCGNSEHPERGG